MGRFMHSILILAANNHAMSDKGRAAIAIAKVIIALVAGGYLGYLWLQLRGAIDEFWVPYVAGLITAFFVYILLIKLGKSSVD
jgi:hypothetical protein